VSHSKRYDGSTHSRTPTNSEPCSGAKDRHLQKNSSRLSTLTFCQSSVLLGCTLKYGSGPANHLYCSRMCSRSVVRLKSCRHPKPISRHPVQGVRKAHRCYGRWVRCARITHPTLRMHLKQQLDHRTTQNMYFRPSCIFRGLPAVKIRPKFGFVKVACGLANTLWLSTLKASKRKVTDGPLGPQTLCVMLRQK